MAPNRGRNRAPDFEDLLEGGSKEFDPEEDDTRSNGDSDGSDKGDENQGREHYGAVSKSELRRPKVVTLGPQYHGAKITRDALQEDEDDDDPFSGDFNEDGSDEEQDSDDLVDDALSDGGEETGDGSMNDTSDTDLSDSEHETGQPLKRKNYESETQNQLRQVVNDESHKSTAFSLSQAAKEDAEKGRSVKRQRTTFDSLLSTRMKLQKSLIATNTLVGLEERGEIIGERDEAKQALVAAETAAFNFWNSLNSLREDLLVARSNKKRKRATFSTETPCEDLVAHVHAQEDESKQLRNSVLEKWSRKAQGPSVVPSRGRLNQDRQATIVDVLQEQLSSMDRLVRKTHAPRSCAPVQVSQRIVEDSKIYDDADFYGLLLKELLEQKSHDSVAASSIDISFQMRRDNKTKRNVDTKASKGRKLRYTVQEKLQNFMAPEDRSTWGERQADELFGSLFGQRMGLGEKDEVDELENDLNSEEAGLMMFRK